MGELHNYAAGTFGDADLINLSTVFLDEAIPDFPDYVVEYAFKTRSNLTRRYRIGKARFWNPFTTLSGLRAWEAMIVTLSLPEEQQNDFNLLLRKMHSCQYWVNEMGVLPVEHATKLAIDTYSGRLPGSWWLRQLTHQVSGFMKCMFSDLSTFVSTMRLSDSNGEKRRWSSSA